MLKVIMYSVDYSEGLLRKLPYVRYFVERSLCHLAELCNPKTRVVLITPKPLDQYVLEYHLKDLYRLDDLQEQSAHDQLVLLSPQCKEPFPLDFLVLHDAAILRILREEIEKATAIELINFASSEACEELGGKLGLTPEEGEYARSRYWGSKSGSKEAFRLSGVPAPRGASGILWTIEEVTSAVFRLAHATPPARYVIVKLNDASWGDAIGNVLINCERFLLVKDLLSSIEVILQPWEAFVREVSTSGAIVEEYLTDAICSPSGQGYISGPGEIVVLATHEQIVVSGQYLGCSFPGRVEFMQKIRQAVSRIGETLSINGVRGTFGVDFIGFQNGDLFATEINVRKVGPSHVLSCVESVVGSKVGDNGYLMATGRPLYYVHQRLYKPEILRNLEPKAAVAALKGSELLYDRSKKTGAILHILGALSTCGYLETTCLADSLGAAFKLDNQVRLALLDEANRHSSRLS